MGYPQIFRPIHTVETLVDNSVDNLGHGLRAQAGEALVQAPDTLWPRYFHCVETPNPAAMKPKPTTMFQLPNASTGSEPSVT